jgi:hypothetical protein
MFYVMSLHVCYGLPFIVDILMTATLGAHGIVTVGIL